MKSDMPVCNSAAEAANFLEDAFRVLLKDDSDKLEQLAKLEAISKD